MKHIKILTLFLLGAFVSSCESDFLEPELTSAINGSNYYKDADQVETAVINMYDGLQGVNSTSSNDNHSTQVEFYVTEMRSDNTRTKSSEGEAAQFESYTLESTNGIVGDYYRSFYNVIFRANTVLENLESAESSAALFEGEAKFVRAYANFNLVRLYGDIPLIDQTIDPLNTDLAFTRVPVAQVYELIVSDLNTAITNLNNDYRTRASRSAAQSLLAKVHLTLGNYTEARTLLESVISSGDFSLEANFNDVFYNESNAETIFAIGYASGGLDSQNFSAEWLNAVGRTSGVNYVTADVRAAFESFGGNRSAVSFRQDASQPEQYQVAKYFPNGELNAPYVSDPTKAGNDWIVLRYSDVLLMHVESILAGANETIDPTALASFQAVRDRAGLTDAVTIVTKNALLNERRVELAFENHRLFDLIRFGVAQDVLSAFSSANGLGFSSTDILLPIPQREIGLSLGLLSQNPGY
ncbi:MAG: RagB/SusD family nutrient uptake outer membrane protein [Candidatus Arcticimaribacter sp.]|nr:MAG: RagB/SusD family nutrient uptake outer membrane protein [Candidatus Arcticimaribacter sp.]